MILLAAFIMGCSVLRQVEAVLPVGSPRSCSWPPPPRWWGPTPPSPASFMMWLALDDGAPSRWRAESTLPPLSFYTYILRNSRSSGSGICYSSYFSTLCLDDVTSVDSELGVNLKKKKGQQRRWKEYAKGPDSRGYLVFVKWMEFSPLLFLISLLTFVWLD